MGIFGKEEEKEQPEVLCPHCEKAVTALLYREINTEDYEANLWACEHCKKVLKIY